MVANSDKFQAIILSKNAIGVSYKLRIYDNEKTPTKSVILLGVVIDYQIKFNEHISTLWSKTAMQLNSLYRLQRYIGKTEKNSTKNFIYSNFNYCPIVMHFCSCKSSHKIEYWEYKYWEQFKLFIFTLLCGASKGFLTALRPHKTFRGTTKKCENKHLT